jgi:undecaprenyl diphosphate synthase
VRLPIGILTVYAFSADNWRRPPAEVSALMALMQCYLEDELALLVRQGIRTTIIGRRDRVPRSIALAMGRAEEATQDGKTALELRIACDYSARDAIRAAAGGCEEPTRDEFARRLGGGKAAPDVDLLIRTGGEKRLSDFLLWEAAYAELHFTDRLWPDFSSDDLNLALRDFHGRQRRFGGLPESAWP